ncbi:MAG: methyltransferase domain-containing protein [Salinibacterium sp.]|nr:methyltransferase domain-containing protein [Salinibacterium sp.]MBF0670996.1 methyltransferase domain-containing protein [Salinibacterium sp.]
MATTEEEFADRVFAAALGAIDTYAIHLGDRLGFYRALADSDALTARELAAASGCSERYAREWLEQQATSGIVEVDLTGEEARFRLPPEHATVLVDAQSSLYLAPLARMLTTSGTRMDELLEAYRTGGGVSWADFGRGLRESQADMNQPFFANELPAVLRDIPGLAEVLSRDRARVADIGCGAGWSSIAIAGAYPNASVHGVDVDEPSLAMARANAEASGVDDRVTFSATAGEDSRAHDAVFAFECVHDMPQPVAVLGEMRRLARGDGRVIVMDEAVGERFTGDADDVERLMYGFSLLVCLPDGLSSSPSLGTGTVMRPPLLQEYATAAGFSEVRTVAEAGFFRFYELVPAG